MAGIAALRRVLDLVLPPVCVSCDVPVAVQGQFCARCFQRCHFISEPMCVRCGVPFAYGGQGAAGVCPACLDHPPVFGTARAAFAYDDQARPLILAFKYADRTELAAVFAPHMARAGAALLAGADWLVPVPLHPARLRRRRYNQAALLARALTRRTGVATVTDGLCRTRPTPPLRETDAAERMELLRGAIAVRARHAGRWAGARVVLVDDVMTSGATANACCTALLAAGAASVDVLTAARVPSPQLDR